MNSQLFLVQYIIQYAIKVALHHRKVFVRKENLVHFFSEGDELHIGVIM